jgi:alpha-L-fucosidase
LVSIGSLIMTQNPDNEWFENAGLGIFVHWGISSVHGGIDLSWGMIEDKPWDDEDRSIPSEEYYALADDFDPDGYNPDSWCRAAREAGMEYAVLTARHHDGFAMWPSEYGDFSTADHCDGRDLVGEFVDACRRQGLRVGLYYSPRDWRFDEFVEPGPYEGKEEHPEAVNSEELVAFEKHFDYVAGQLEELVTRYGDLDVLWFDGYIKGNVNRGAAELLDIVRSANPDVLVNDRCGPAALGDFRTTEVQLPERPLDGTWEHCQTWGGPWGYTDDDEYADLAWTVDRLTDVAGLGGNLLLNVSPDQDGRLPDEAHERLGELGSWMDAHGPAIKNVEGGPWPPRTDVSVTRDEHAWYLHVPADHDDVVTVEHVPQPRSVQRLRDGASLEATHEEGSLAVTVPGDEREWPVEVVVVTWDHPARTDEGPRLGRPR